MLVKTFRVDDMQQSVICTSKKGNWYLYDDQYSLSMLIHPELAKTQNVLMNSDSYYVKKYEYLKKHGFFLESKIVDFETKLSKEKVEKCLIQTPQILFEVTDMCNLNCVYCALGELYEWGENRNSKRIDIDAAIKLLKHIFLLKLQNEQYELTISFYGGEPLLNFDFIKRIICVVQDLNIEKKMNIRYSMTTNAVLIDNYIDYLVCNNFNILVSLDGNERNNSYRIFRKSNKNSFDKIISNLDMIQRRYPVFFEKNISFNAVLHDRNSVKDVYEFIYNRYHKIPQVSELNNVEINSSKRDVLEKMFHSVRESESEYIEDTNCLFPHNKQTLFHELSNFLRYFSVNSYVLDATLFLFCDHRYYPACTCFPFSKKIFLTTNNTLLPCERINYKYSLGSVDQDVEIDVEKIIEQYSVYYNNLVKMCKSCYLYRFCGICFYHIKGIDKLDNKEFSCDLFHDLKAFRIKLNRVFSFLEEYPDDFFEIFENEIIVS